MLDTPMTSPIVGVLDAPCDAPHDGGATYHCKLTSNIDIYPSTSWGVHWMPPLWGCQTPPMMGVQPITGNFIKNFYFVSTLWKIIIPLGIVWRPTTTTPLPPHSICAAHIPPSHHTHPPPAHYPTPTYPCTPSTPPYTHLPIPPAYHHHTHPPHHHLHLTITHPPHHPTCPQHTTTTHTHPPPNIPPQHAPTHPLQAHHPPHEPSNHPPTETKWAGMPNISWAPPHSLPIW